MVLETCTILACMCLPKSCNIIQCPCKRIFSCIARYLIFLQVFYKKRDILRAICKILQVFCKISASLYNCKILQVIFAGKVQVGLIFMRNIFIGSYWHLTATLILLSILLIFDIIWTINIHVEFMNKYFYRCSDVYKNMHLFLKKKWKTP